MQITLDRVRQMGDLGRATALRWQQQGADESSVYWIGSGNRAAVSFRIAPLNLVDILQRDGVVSVAETYVHLVDGQNAPGTWRATWFFDPRANTWWWDQESLHGDAREPYPNDWVR